MRRRYREFEARETAVLVVSFAPVDRLEEYRQYLELPFTIASDHDRLAYRAYGLTRGSLLQVWGPRVIWRYLNLVIRGRKLKRPEKGDDLSQLGGDFVVARDGSLLYRHISQSPADRPPVEDLLRALTR